MLRSSQQLIWNLTIYPSWSSVFSLTHHQVSDFDTICNSFKPSLADIIRFTPLRIVVSLTILGEVSTPYKECFVPFSNRCGISQVTLLGGPVFSLAHRPVSDFDTICNSLRPPLADIVHFNPLHIALNLTVLGKVSSPL